MKALLARTWLTLRVTSLRAQCDLLWQWTWDARKTPGPSEGGRNKEFKGQRSKSGFGERSGKKEHDPMLEINQVMWNAAQMIVLLEIGWVESHSLVILGQIFFLLAPKNEELAWHREWLIVALPPLPLAKGYRYYPDFTSQQSNYRGQFVHKK